MPSVFLGGPRQAGKSTLVKQICEEVDAEYRTLDEPAQRFAAESDPGEFLRTNAKCLIIDEVQRVPALAIAIKSQIDLDRAYGKFLLTGSAGILTQPKLADALVGRMGVMTLRPFSMNEINGSEYSLLKSLMNGDDLPAMNLEISRADLVELMRRGGYPGVVAQLPVDARSDWFNSLSMNLIEREIRELSAIEGLNQIPNLLRLLASRTSNLINQSEVSRASGIPLVTLRRYMSLLSGVFSIDVIPSWSNNRTKQASRAGKLLLSDVGVATHLLRLGTGEVVEDLLWGQVLETFVGNELQKHIEFLGPEWSLYHYRTHGGAEVDFVVEGPGGKIVGVEVKLTSKPGKSTIKGLTSLRESAKDKWAGGLVLYSGSQIVPTGNRMWIAPVSILWQH